MTTSSTQDVLAEVWAIKDSLSASHGHSLKATCRAMYAEQQKHPGDFVNLGAAPKANQVEVTGLRLSALPHHPACGSAPGGSSQIMEL
jgi:hypothetical protein